MEREGIDINRSTLADWVGQIGAFLTPLADAPLWQDICHYLKFNQLGR